MDPEVEYSWDRKHAGDAFKTTVADILPRTRRNTLIALCVGVAYVLWRGRSPRSPSMTCWRSPQSLTMRSGPRPPTTATFRWLRRRT